MKQTFESFKETIKNRIGEYLTEDYEDATYEVQEVKKSNGNNYDALMIRRAGEQKYAVVPALNLSSSFEEYQGGKDIEDILKELADIRMNAPIPEGLCPEMFSDFDTAKSKVFPRLINFVTSSAFLETRPHIVVEDLAIVFTLRINENSTGFAEAVIDNDLMERWGVTADDLHKTAMENLADTDAVFCNLEDAMFGHVVSGFDLDAIDEDCPVPLFMLTNKQKTKGSIMCLCSKYMDQIIDKFGEVYVLPSSMDEVLIMPKGSVQNHEMEVSDLVRMVRQVNEEAVRPEDRLSDNVYEYNAETRRLVLATVA
ncbi:MAG: hypothetical protein IKT20_01260 [Clostridiales bacterium]|nr:hypothetical protein [Clostridiales bacterium]